MKDWIGNERSPYIQIGASNHSEGDRALNDFYATDPKALKLFSENYDIPHHIWEPCCGMGHLSEFLLERGHEVYSSDLVDRGYGISPVDFFAQRSALGSSQMRDYAILTNPPYRYANDFVVHALALLKDGQQLILFLKTSFLEGFDRYIRIFKNTPPGLYISTLDVLIARRMDVSF